MPTIDGVKYFLNITYAVVGEGINSTQTGLQDPTKSGVLRILSYVEESKIAYPVEEITVYAFFGCSYITCVIIPPTMKRIGWASFARMTSLEEIVIPDINKISVLGPHLFYSSNKLFHFTIPSNLISVEGQPFAFSSLTDIYYCGKRDVSFQNLDFNGKVHVSMNYHHQTFLGKNIVKDIYCNRYLFCETKRIISHHFSFLFTSMIIIL